ncbi:hypothetical protein [Streptosporangium sp. NPDC051022]|uniref:hypothetical protein n=1 Tax=Streptosporangium sp. NPDC051022 TaxID=3155752 RepID=UPI0034309DEC
MPEYRDDILAEIGTMKRQIAEAFGTGQQRVPITEASAGWFMPNRTEPPAPLSGVHIYASGGEFRVKTSSGVVRGIIPPQGTAVANPAVVLHNPPASYTQAQIQEIVNTLDSVSTQFLALLTSLRNAGIIST